MWVALSALHMFLIISSLKDFWQLKLLLGEAPTNTAVFHGHAEPSLFIYTFTGYFFHLTIHTHRGARSTIQATLGTSLVAWM